MVGWHFLNIKPKDPEKSIVFNFQFDLITLASKDVFIKLLPNTNVIKTLDKSSKIVMWIMWNLHNVFSTTCQFSNLVKHLNLLNFVELSKSIVYSQKFFRQCKKNLYSNMEMPVLRFLHINTFVWKLWFKFQPQFK